MDITYNLPHPVRTTATEMMEQSIQLQDGMFDQIFTDLKFENCSIDYLISIIAQKAPTLIETHISQGLSHHNACMSIATALTAYKHRKVNGNILTTSNEIDVLLEKTDIGDEIPIAYLRPPFTSCYIEFTEDRSSSLKVYNEESGEHILEGVYISETEVLPESQEMKRYEGHSYVDTTKKLRVLDIMFTGSPIGKSHITDDALRTQGFYIQDDNLTITDELKSVVNLYGNDADFANDINYLSATLEHMAKVLLFVNCKQYRDTAFNERLELKKKISAIKSPGKLKKYNKKLRKTYCKPPYFSST